MIRETETARVQLVRQRTERLQAFTEDDHVARNLADQIAGYDETLATLRARSHAGFGPDGVSVQEIRLRMESLQKQVAGSRDLVGALESQSSLWQIRARQPANAIAVIKPAIPLRERAGPSKRDTIGASLLIAFILGLVVVMLREQWERVATEPYLMQRAEEIRMHARMLAPSPRFSRVLRRQPVGSSSERAP